MAIFITDNIKDKTKNIIKDNEEDFTMIKGKFHLEDRIIPWECQGSSVG